MKSISHSLEETHRIAKQWLEDVSKENANSPTALVVGLSGNLGAGKTTFTKALAKELGITEEITSPTFVIMKSYPTTHATFKNLIHIDAYRLERGQEFQVLGFEKLASNKNNLIIIEWPENVKEALSSLSMKTIYFEVVNTDNEGEARKIGWD